MEVAVKTLETETVSPDQISENESDRNSKSKHQFLSTSNASDDNDANDNQKGLVADYVSDVSSEDFSGPEDGECESDGGTGGANPTAATASRHHRPARQPITGPPKSSSRRRVVLPPDPARSVQIAPALVENASPIEDEDYDLDDLSEFL